MQVWAGLAAMDAGVLQNIPASVLSIYFLAWSPSMLDVPQFISVLPSPKDCTNECATYIQPGGVAIVRQYGSNLNTTLLEEDTFAEADALLIEKAPGIVTQFTQPVNDVYFTVEDCQLYGPIRGDAIYICIQPAGSGSAVIGKIVPCIMDCADFSGWGVCPTANYNHNVESTCMTNTNWTETIAQVTNVTTYTQFTTTSYGGQNLSIIETMLIGNQQPLAINIDGFKAMWAMLFGSNSTTPSNQTSISDDQVMTDSLMFELGWYLRLYEDQFHGDRQSPLDMLRNFITVPLQFYTTAMQAWNATKAAEGLTSLTGGVAMPDDMRTTVSTAHSEWRWKAPLSSVIPWIIITMILVLLCGAILFWILILSPPEFGAMGSSPVDILSVSGPGCVIEDPRSTLANFVGSRHTTDMIPMFRGKNGYLIEAECHTHEVNHVLFVVDEGV
jgi:hypothetical protein